MTRTKEFDPDEILNKAIDLFWDKGYNGCSMQDIVEGLGLSRSSIYETFGDKRQLFLEALKKYQRAGLEAMKKDVNAASDVREVLVQIFESILPGNLNCSFERGCFMVNSAIELAPHDPDIAAIVKDNQREVEDILCKAIEKGQQSGQVTTSLDARSIARFLYTNISGMRVTARSGADRKELEAVIKVALSVLQVGASEVGHSAFR
jgi:TetR/AcrR family transcriptional repressor of nem operon